MGTIKYDGVAVDFDDHLLAHLEMVVVQKLRRQESFLLTWNNPEHLGGGRTGIWLHEAVALTFHFDSPEARRIDRDWLERLMASANSPMGLFAATPDGAAVHPSDLEISGVTP